MSGLIQAGRLNRTILLQTAVKTQDSVTGEEVIAWDAETLPAQWLPGNTREAYQAQQRLASYIDGVFRIRYRQRPTPNSHRIVCDGRIYDIKPPVELGLHEGWDVPVVAQGDTP